MELPLQYFLFYKPFQVLSQFSAEENKKTLSDFFPGIKKDIYPVGRLDYDSEGLLLLTNDKQLNHRLLHPKFIHEREYWPQVEGIPDVHELRKLEEGIIINVDGKPYKTWKAEVRMLENIFAIAERNPPIRYRKSIPASWLSLTLIEGKNRQVRKMTAAIGYPTLRLIRYRIGGVTIDNMLPGDIIEADNSIIKELFRCRYNKWSTFASTKKY